MSLPSITFSQMRRVDRAAIEKYKIPSLILMEHAGLAVAQTVRSILKKSKKNRVIVVTGKGNNAGDGFVAARWLIQFGYTVMLFNLAASYRYEGDTRINYRICKKLKIPEISLMRCNVNRWTKSIKSASLVVDAIFGTGFRGHVETAYGEVIETINQYARKIVSVDVPSGLAEGGGEADPCIRADVTVTMGLPKIILTRKSARSCAGKLIVADIGIPNEAMKHVIVARHKSQEHK